MDGSGNMEFTSAVYALMYRLNMAGVNFPPYWDLMPERDVLDLCVVAMERHNAKHR